MINKIVWMLRLNCIFGEYFGGKSFKLKVTIAYRVAMDSCRQDVAIIFIREVNPR